MDGKGLSKPRPGQVCDGLCTATQQAVGATGQEHSLDVSADNTSHNSFGVSINIDPTTN